MKQIILLICFGLVVATAQGQVICQSCACNPALCPTKCGDGICEGNETWKNCGDCKKPVRKPVKPASSITKTVRGKGTVK